MRLEHCSVVIRLLYISSECFFDSLLEPGRVDAAEVVAEGHAAVGEGSDRSAEARHPGRRVHRRGQITVHSENGK